MLNLELDRVAGEIGRCPQEETPLDLGARRRRRRLRRLGRSADFRKPRQREAGGVTDEFGELMIIGRGAETLAERAFDCG